MLRGTIFDIKRYAIHDGPGIRTSVFFKGCPLRCRWCHNPESMENSLELMLRANRWPKECRDCLSVCPAAALSKNRGLIRIDRKKCNLCANCREACAYDALEIAGRQVTVPELIEEIERDRLFFDESGGGVTLSGGEPLAQPDFLEDLTKEIKRRGIHLALDTSGQAPFEVLGRINDKVDLYLYDLKIMAGGKHKEYTGVSNKVILGNLRKLSETRKPVAVRIPLISGINDDEENIRMALKYLDSLQGIKEINILPYHKGGKEKYKRLRMETSPGNFQAPTAERLDRIIKSFSAVGFSVKIGG